MRNQEFMVGVAADLETEALEGRELMRQAGIRWLRTDKLGFDIGRFLANGPEPKSLNSTKELLARLREDGFQVLGITPGPRDLGDAAGVPGSQEYNENYRRMCAFLGKEFRGLIDYWQVANELDIWIFRGRLTLPQSVEFLKCGIQGLKGTDAELKVGINITLFPSRPGEVDGNTNAHEGIFLAQGIYHDPSLDLDYAGFDSYPGTWRDGGVKSWDEYLDAFHELTRKPVLIQEFGYSSAGEMMSDEEKRSGVYPCKVKRWRFAWNGGHTPEIQARFIEESFQKFAGKPFVLGATYFRWKDQKRCWQCGSADCPMETAWGLLDRNGNPKPSYHAFRASVSALGTGEGDIRSGQPSPRARGSFPHETGA